jgi:hypothetical protein
MPDNPPKDKDKGQGQDKGGPPFGQGVPPAPAATPANPPQPGGNVVQTPGQTQPAAGQAPPVQQQAAGTTAQAAGTGTGAPKVDMTLAHTLAQTMALIQAQQSAPAVGRDDADETHEGGKYVVDGREVNAWGADFREGQSAHDDNPELTRFNRPR